MGDQELDHQNKILTTNRTINGQIIVLMIWINQSINHLFENTGSKR